MKKKIWTRKAYIRDNIAFNFFIVAGNKLPHDHRTRHSFGREKYNTILYVNHLTPLM